MIFEKTSDMPFVYMICRLIVANTHVVFKILKMKNTYNFISNDVASAKKEKAVFDCFRVF